MRFVLEVAGSILWLLVGYRAGKQRVRMVVDNWIRYRIVESGHNRIDKLCLPLLDSLKSRMKDL